MRITLIILALLTLTTAAHAADLRPGQLTVYTWDEDGELHITRRWDFTKSRFALPSESVREACDRACATVRRAQRVEAASQYIETVNPRIDAQGLATAIVAGSEEYEDWLLPLALAVARYESSMRVHVGSKYYGLYQLDAGRRKVMRQWGLDPASAEAQTQYFCNYIEARLAEGKTLRQALRPWSVRDRALREWERIKDGFPPQ